MNNIKATSKLIFKTLVGQPIGAILSLIAPVVLIIFLPYLFNPIMTGNMKQTLKMTIPGLLLIPPLIIGFLGIPITYGTLKETAIIKRLNVVSVKPHQFIISIILVFTTLIIFSTLVQFTVAWLIHGSNMTLPKNGLFIIPYLFMIFISLMFGILISNLAKSQALAFAIGIATFLPTMFLSGLLFAKLEGWVKYISWFIPHTSFINLFKLSWMDGSLNFANVQNDLTWFNKTGSTIFAFIYPLTISALQTGVIIRKFEFE